MGGGGVAGGRGLRRHGWGSADILGDAGDVRRTLLGGGRQGWVGGGETHTQALVLSTHVQGGGHGAQDIRREGATHTQKKEKIDKKTFQHHGGDDRAPFVLRLFAGDQGGTDTDVEGEG